MTTSQTKFDSAALLILLFKQPIAIYSKVVVTLELQNLYDRLTHQWNSMKSLSIVFVFTIVHSSLFKTVTLAIQRLTMVNNVDYIVLCRTLFCSYDVDWSVVDVLRKKKRTTGSRSFGKLFQMFAAFGAERTPIRLSQLKRHLPMD